MDITKSTCLIFQILYHYSFNVHLELILLHYLISLPYLTQLNVVTLNSTPLLSMLEWCIQRGHYSKWFYCNGTI